MSDQADLLALLQRFGIEPAVNPERHGEWPAGCIAVSLNAYEGGVDGYIGFVCRFTFSEAGEFQGVGVWE